MAQSFPLVERDEPLALLRSRVDQACRGGGSAVAVSGPAGLGKTALLRELHRSSTDATISWLTAAGRESEREFAFGVALQLIRPAWVALSPREQGELLAGAPELATRLLAGEAEEPERPAALFAQVNALFWVVAGLAERTPLVLSVDNAQWLDVPTLTLLGFLAERVADLPVVVVLGVRTREPEVSPQLGMLLELGAVESLPLQPLSPEAVGEVLAHTLEQCPAPEFVEACAEVSHGYPLLLHDLMTEFLTTGLAPTAESAAAVATLQPATVARRLRKRLGQVRPAAQQFARALAVLECAPLELAARVAGQTPRTAARSLDELVRVALADSQEGTVFFAHPLVRSAVIEAIGPGERVQLHSRAAAHLLEARAPAERIAAHLLETSGASDAAYLPVLERAAQTAMSHAAPAQAAALLRRALQLPAGEVRRADLLAECARAATAAGEPDGPDQLLEAATLTADPAVAAERRLLSGRLLLASAHVERMLDATDPVVDDPALPEALRREARAMRLVGVLLTPTLAGRVDDTVDELLAQEQEPTSGTERGLLAIHALQGAMLGTSDAAEAAAIAGRAYADGQLLDDDVDVTTISCVIGAYAGSGHLHDAVAIGDELLRRATASGSQPEIALSAFLRGWPRALIGCHQDALTDFETALGTAGSELYAPSVVAFATRSWLELDDLDAAEAMHARWDLHAAGASATMRGLWRVAGAKLALMRNDPARALELALAASEDLALRLPGPGAEWRLVAGEALSLLGRREEALALIDEEIALLEGWGAPGPLGMAKRARGRALGTDEAALPLLWEAVELLAASQFRGDHARALIDLGWALRRAGRRRDAVEQLRIGLELAGDLGLVRGERIAREELAAAGHRPRRTALTGVAALTPSERRVCELAAGGASNREIAQRLFVTIKAVEKHLANAYRKLEIRSRRELPAALALA